MWYFSWVLGLGLACAFAILNAMWLEIRDDDDRRQAETSTAGTAPR
jgi:cyd operon protein YbgT